MASENNKEVSFLKDMQDANPKTPYNDSENHLARMAAVAKLELLQPPFDLQSVLGRIAEITEELLPSTGGASIVLWDFQEGKFYVSASTVSAQPPQTTAQRVRKSSGASRWVVDNDRSVVVTDIRNDPFQANPMLDEFGLKAYVGMPIHSEGQVVGVLYALEAHARDYSEEDLTFLGILADRAGSAITNSQLFYKIELQATKDPLTGLHNRRAFLARAKEELVRAQRFGHPVSVLMIDIDHFKSINDNYGHHIGDIALQRVAQDLKSTCRQIDLLCRYGGEEFVILLPETDLQSAQGLAERLREQIDANPLLVNDAAIDVTISIGVTTRLEDDHEVPVLINRADVALYAAKRSGRNRVVVLTENKQQK